MTTKLANRHVTHVPAHDVPTVWLNNELRSERMIRLEWEPLFRDELSRHSDSRKRRDRSISRTSTSAVRSVRSA